MEVWKAYQAAIARRDWDAVAECIAEDAAIEDRRPLGLGRLEGRDQIIAYLQGMVELVTDSHPEVTRILHEGECSFAAEIAIRGTGFEITYALVGEIADDRLKSAVFYEPGDPRVNAQPE